MVLKYIYLNHFFKVYNRRLPEEGVRELQEFSAIKFEEMKTRYEKDGIVSEGIVITIIMMIIIIIYYYYYYYYYYFSNILSVHWTISRRSLLHRSPRKDRGDRGYEAWANARDIPER